MTLQRLLKSYELVLPKYQVRLAHSLSVLHCNHRCLLVYALLGSPLIDRDVIKTSR